MSELKPTFRRHLRSHAGVRCRGIVLGAQPPMFYGRHVALQPTIPDFEAVRQPRSDHSGQRLTGLVSTPSSPMLLFTIPDDDWYAVSSDGARFLVRASAEPRNSAAIQVVLNWTEELRKQIVQALPKWRVAEEALTQWVELRPTE